MAGAASFCLHIHHRPRTYLFHARDPSRTNVFHIHHHCPSKAGLIAHHSNVKAGYIIIERREHQMLNYSHARNLYATAFPPYDFVLAALYPAGGAAPDPRLDRGKKRCPGVVLEEGVSSLTTSPGS
ncbi:hypothetical protein ES703_58743 [subsurface metagenome]